MQTWRLYLSAIYIFIFSSIISFLVHSYAPKARMLHVARRLVDMSLQSTVRHTCCVAVSRKAYTPLRTANILPNLASTRTSFDCFFLCSLPFLAFLSFAYRYACKVMKRNDVQQSYFSTVWLTVFVIIVSHFISFCSIHTHNAQSRILEYFRYGFYTYLIFVRFFFYFYIVAVVCCTVSW